MNENIKVLKQIHKLEHEIFMLRCKTLENYLTGKKTEEIENIIAIKEIELAQLKKD